MTDIPQELQLALDDIKELVKTKTRPKEIVPWLTTLCSDYEDYRDVIIEAAESITPELHAAHGYLYSRWLVTNLLTYAPTHHVDTINKFIPHLGFLKNNETVINPMARTAFGLVASGKMPSKKWKRGYVTPNFAVSAPSPTKCRHTLIVNDNNGETVVYDGCIFGTIDEFRKTIDKTHPKNKPGRPDRTHYLGVARMARNFSKLQL